MAMNKTRNQYQQLISEELYEKTPKAVFAAIAVSLFVIASGEEDFSDIDRKIITEWMALHGNAIVPQKPPKIED